MYSEVLNVLSFPQLHSVGAGSEDLPLWEITKRENECQEFYAEIVNFLSLDQRVNAQLYRATTLLR